MKPLISQNGKPSSFLPFLDEDPRVVVVVRLHFGPNLDFLKFFPTLIATFVTMDVTHNLNRSYSAENFTQKRWLAVSFSFTTFNEHESFF